MAENDNIATCEDEIRACIPPNYTYLFESTTCTFQSKQNFAATLRIKEVTDKEKAKKWLEDLTQYSYVTWRCQTQPRCRMKNSFKSYLKCQHRSSSKPLKNSRISKNTNCNASLILIVRRTDFNRFSRSTDPDPLLMDWPCIVILSNIHNHRLDSADILRFRNMSLNTQTRLLDMFKLGHSPSSAFHTLETELCLENSEACHDGAYLPTVGRITHFFNPQFKAHFKSKSVQDIVLESQKLLVEWGQITGGKYVVGTTNNNRYYVALCTPLMCRVHELVAQSSDIVYLEAVGGLDRQRHRVYFLVVATAAGGLPLGVIISNSKSEEILTSAISDWQSVCFPPGAFYFSGSPKIIVADHLRELNVLQHHFPSATILISSFHVLQDAWYWLSDSSRNNVAEADRSVLYQMLKAMVRCDSEMQLNASYQELLEHPLCGVHHTFKTYVTKLWESRKEWAYCYQKDLPIVRCSLSVLSNVAFRILRDVLFLRVMAFRLTPLVDFVINQYEKYIEKTLLFYAPQVKGKFFLSMFLPCTTDIITDDICPHPEVEGHFLVPCNKAENTIMYDVDTADMTCSCLSSCGTKMCKHASAVLQMLVVDSTLLCNPSTIFNKDTAVEVAKGGTSSRSAVSMINENDENEQNYNSLILTPMDGGNMALADGMEAVPLAESSQNIVSPTVVSEDLTPVPESTASLIKYAISNGLFGENVVIKLVIEENQSCAVPLGETVSGDFLSGQLLSYQVPVGGCYPPVQLGPGGKSGLESNCTLMITTAPLSSSDNVENPTRVDVTSASVYLTEAASGSRTQTHSTGIDESTITDSITLNRHDDKRMLNLENCTDSSKLTTLLADASENMPKIYVRGPKVETVEKSPNTPEYSISDVAAVTEIMIPDQDVFETNDSENRDMISDTEERFDTLIGRIKESKKANPAIFSSAIRKMVSNAQTYAQTEEELACALASFAQPPGLVRPMQKRKLAQSRLANTKMSPY